MDQGRAQEATTIEMLVSYQLITSRLTSEEIRIRAPVAEYNHRVTAPLTTESHLILDRSSHLLLAPKTTQPGGVRAPGSTLTYNQDCITQRLEIRAKVHSP